MKYTVFYDANCALCSHEIGLIMGRNTNDSLIAAPLDENLEVLASLGISREQAMALLYIADENGKLFIGIDAIRLMYRECGWRWQSAVLGLPIIHQISALAYRIFAKYRYLLPKTLLHKDKDMNCENDSCGRPPPKP